MRWPWAKKPKTLVLPEAGKLTCDGWMEWDRDSKGIVAVDTWVEGFSPGEIEALGGYHCVRVWLWFNEDGTRPHSFTIYDDREEDDVLEPVMARNERGSCYDVQPPGWLKERILSILPTWEYTNA